jgi:glutamine synthetase
LAALRATAIASQQEGAQAFFSVDDHDNPLSIVESAGPLGRYLGGFGDLKMCPDMATAIPLPGDSYTWAAVRDVTWPDGEPVAVAPRRVLTEQLSALEGAWLMPSVGIEHEVVFLDGQGKSLTAHGVDYALGGTERMGAGAARCPGSAGGNRPRCRVRPR